MNNMFSKAAIWVVIALVLFTVFKQFDTRGAAGASMLGYSDFLEQVRNKQIKSAIQEGMAEGEKALAEAKAAIRDDDPVLFLENLTIYNLRGEVPEGDYVVPIGVAAVPRTGRDLTIVSHSYGTVRALQVADRLEAEGISAEVVDLRSLRPLDMETVANSVRKTHRVLCVEEGWPSFGVSAEIAARIQKACFTDLDAPVERVGGAEVPMPYSRPLERAAQVNDDKILAAARSLLAESGILRRGVPVA